MSIDVFDLAGLTCDDVDPLTAADDLNPAADDAAAAVAAAAAASICMEL